MKEQELNSIDITESSKGMAGLVRQLLKAFGQGNMNIGVGNRIEGGEPSGNLQVGVDNVIRVDQTSTKAPLVIKGNIQIGKNQIIRD